MKTIFFCGHKSPFGLAHLEPLIKCKLNVKYVVFATNYRWVIFRKKIGDSSRILTPLKFIKQLIRKATNFKNVLESIKLYNNQTKIEKMLRKSNIIFMYEDDVNSDKFITKIRNFNLDLMLSAAYPQIFSKQLISLFPKGAVNFHPSLLPKYRGAHPHFWVIVYGEKESGLSAHFMTEKIDNGDIVAQIRFPIDKYTYRELYTKMLIETPEFVRKVADYFLNENQKPIKQNELESTYFKNDKEEDRRICWDKYDCLKIYNLIRTGVAFYYFKNKRVTVLTGLLIKLTTNSDKTKEEMKCVVERIDNNGLVLNVNGGCICIKEVMIDRRVLLADYFAKKMNIKVGEIFYNHSNSAIKNSSYFEKRNKFHVENVSKSPISIQYDNTQEIISHDIKDKSVSGVKWTMIAAIVATIIQVSQLIILTHFLSRAEYGEWGIIGVLIGFSSLFVDMGLSNAIIHFQEIEEDELSSLYWFNVIMGVIIYFILIIISPFVAVFYKTMVLRKLIPLVALTFIIVPFGQQYQALLQKELKFKTISIIEIISKSAGFIMTIFLLFAGFKIYSVIYSLIATAALSSLLYIFIENDKYRPRFVIRIRKVSRFLRFGIFQLLNSTTNYFNLQFDSLLIGRLLGMEALGLYTLAKNLLLRPMFIINPIITRVTFPMMSKVQNNTRLLRKTYLKTVTYLSAVNFPIYLFMAFFTSSIVSFTFGSKWTSSIILMQILSFWAIFRSTLNPIGSLIMAKGKTDWEFYWNLVLLFISPMSLYVSSFWGLKGICWGLLIYQALLQIPAWYFLIHRLCHARFIEYLYGILRPFLLALCAVVCAFGLTFWVSSDILHLVIAFIVFCGVYWQLNVKYNPDFLQILGEIIYKKI